MAMFNSRRPEVLVATAAVVFGLAFVCFVIADHRAVTQRRVENGKGRKFQGVLKSLRRRVAAVDERIELLGLQITSCENKGSTDVSERNDIEKTLLGENEGLMALMLELDGFGSNTEGMTENNMKRKRESIAHVQAVENKLDLFLTRIRTLPNNPTAFKGLDSCHHLSSFKPCINPKPLYRTGDDNLIS